MTKEKDIENIIAKIDKTFMGNSLIDRKFPELRKYLLKKFSKSKELSIKRLIRLYKIDKYFNNHLKKYKKVIISNEVIYYFNTYIKDDINDKIIRKLFLKADNKHRNIKKLPYVIQYLENYNNEYRKFQQVLPHILFNKPLPVGIPKTITDKFIIDYFWDNRRKSLMNGRMNKNFLKNFPTITQYLKNRYPDDDFISFKHVVLRIFNKVEHLKTCEYKNCNNKIYDLDPRRRFCSLKCAQNSEEVNKKRSKSLEKCKDRGKKISENKKKWWENLSKEKFEALNNHHKETLRNRSEEEKHRHGERVVESKIKNNTMSRSKEQILAYENLIKIFGKKNVFCEYKDKEKYPYYCDIYIKPYDLFIEINFFPAHGDCWFDDKNKNHLKILNQLKKSNRPFDVIKIKVWTISDPIKRKIAESNKLNYKVFWDPPSLWKWIGILEYDKNYLTDKKYRDYDLKKEVK